MIKIVLDTTAILGYLAGSINVGEPIREVADEGHQVGLPVPCLAEAAAQNPGHHMLDVLERLPNTVVLPLTEDWRALAVGLTVTGGVTWASAWIEAVEHHAYLLTAEPDVYGGPDAGDIISIT